MYTIKIFLRTDQISKEGKHAVCLRLIINRRKKDVSLRIYVKPKDWNFNRLVVNRSDIESERKNRLLKKLKNKAENIVDDCFFSNQTIVFDDFVANLFNKDYNDESFIEFAIDRINEQNFTKETLKTYITQITKLKRFKTSISFSEINKSFILKYKEFMLKTLKNSPNTANKSLGMLKTFANWAVQDNLLKENPFEYIKIVKGKGKREYLSVMELEKLEELYKRNNLGYRQLNVLRYFLFVCYTGLRYSDIKELKYSDIKKRLLNDAETEFIEMKMHKTSLEVTVPIIKKAKELMPKKIIANQKVFRVLSNQKTNQYLKEIIKEAGIDKNITFHCARHTLATTGLERGIPIEVISRILGHTEIKITQIYAKVNDNLKYKEMLKLDKKSDGNAA